MPGALVADVETRFTCTVTYGSPTTDIPFTLEVEDEMGNRIANYNDSIIDLITDGNCLFLYFYSGFQSFSLIYPENVLFENINRRTIEI